MNITSRQPRRTRLGRRSIQAAVVAIVAMLLSLSLAAAAPQAAPAAAPGPVTGDATCAPACDLYATTGTLSLPGGGSVPIWGYSTSSTPGSATLPGPVLIATAGTAANITLHNVDLPSATSLMIAGQPGIPDTVGATAGNSKIYSIGAGALQPGTYLYEAGLTSNGPRQVAMGLFGALIVRPAACPATPCQAYASPSTTFDDEAALVLSEIDPAFNAAPTTFNMSEFAPKYWLINGKGYSDTAPIATDVNRRVLLRYVNAGLQPHSMGLLGLHQTIVAINGEPKPIANQSRVVAETIPAGSTLDTIVTMPASAPASAKYALFEAAMHVDNNGATTSGAINFGGMMTFLTIATGSSGSGGPVTSAVSLSPNPTSGPAGSAPGPVTLSATITAGATAAEYYVDTLGASGSGCSISGSLTSVSVSIPVSGAVAPCADLTTLSSDNHTFYVHGFDGTTWGAYASAVLNLDKLGPAISNMVLTPTPTNGSVNVQVQATASDVATGNQNVTAAEYNIDGGTATAMSANYTAATVSLNATIPAATVAALSDGNHAVNIRAQDALGNWGAFNTINLTVDKIGPTISGVFATPSASNGANGVQIGTGGGFYQRIDAKVDDAAAGNSKIVAAEYFIDTLGAHGTGGAMLSVDGVYSSPTENVYAAIDLFVINQLGTGNHTIYVCGKDAAGNWSSTCATTTLLVDKTAPTFTSITLAPNPTLGAANVTLTVNGATDPLVSGLASGVAGGEYWINPPTATTPAPGSGTQFSGLTASIPVGALVPGNYTVSARIRDAAGNWSTVIRTATLTVSYPPIYFSTSGNTSPPGVGGSADDADIYFYNGAIFSRSIDASAAPYGLPSGANVDGFDRVDATHFYMSFSGTTTSVPGIGNVQDEDIVYYNAGTWSVYFDGTAHGLGTSGNLDIDAFDIVGGTLYFSTLGNTNPPGVGGTADDADIYSWNGTSYSRVFDASANGLPGGANVDGFVRVDATHFYASFSADTAVPGLGTVQDEDIVYYNAGTWSVYFDGTVLGLTSNNQDIDAFDLP
jgi:hypothetical protein